MASDTPEIKSSDWPKWSCVLFVYFPSFLGPNVISDGPTNGL